ncbi:DUF2946 family protein [Delftia sp. PS-11]|uniref:DUF2946 family protein n=1 Tax=Delftia sp. PS-11 TaxID=2767222 RepID=UPI002455599B|nr:DUF2946 family protein [Delftia sp. PS-11]
MLWLWLALLAAVGHDLLPSLHQHAHLSALVQAAAQSPEQGAQADTSPSAPQRTTADADDCAICAHLAGACFSLLDQPRSFAPLPHGPPRLAPRHTVALPRIAWLFAAPRAPPFFSVST